MKNFIVQIENYITYLQKYIVPYQDSIGQQNLIPDYHKYLNGELPISQNTDLQVLVLLYQILSLQFLAKVQTYISLSYNVNWEILYQTQNSIPMEYYQQYIQQIQQNPQQNDLDTYINQFTNYYQSLQQPIQDEEQKQIQHIVQ